MAEITSLFWLFLDEDVIVEMVFMQHPFWTRGTVPISAVICSAASKDRKNTGGGFRIPFRTSGNESFGG